jgi:hypothetical protein
VVYKGVCLALELGPGKGQKVAGTEQHEGQLQDMHVLTLQFLSAAR